MVKAKPQSKRPWWQQALLGLVVLFVASAIGVGSAWWVLKRTAESSHYVKIGPWQSSTLTGSLKADMYTRARVALHGLLALGRDETMYFVAYDDEQGRPLRSECTYMIQGHAPQARWWSLTAYARDLYLFDVPSKSYTLSSAQAVLDHDGRFFVTVGPKPFGKVRVKMFERATPDATASSNGKDSQQVALTPVEIVEHVVEMPWLATLPDQGLVLTIRLYNPAAGLQAAPRSFEAPRIVQLGGC